MKKLIYLLVALCLHHVCSAQKQGKEKTDSLFSVLSTISADTSKVITLNALAEELLTNDPDTSLYFASESFALAAILNDTMNIADGSFLRILANDKFVNM